jgi:hypothetical protein
VIRRFASVAAEPDTIAERYMPSRTSSSWRPERSTASLSTIPPFSAPDQWLVSPDGTVIIARVREYRLEVLTPDGGRRLGPPIPYDRVVVTRSDRDGYLGRFRERFSSMIPTEVVNTHVRAIKFPEHRPPFDGTIHVAPDRRIWIPRPAVASEGPLTYDVVAIDDGRLIERVVMPPDTKILGFGSEALYAVFVDEFDLLRARRYTLEPRR